MAFPAFTINGQQAKDSIHVDAGKAIQAKVDYQLTNASDVTITWEILPESTDIKAGGDYESRPPALTEFIIEQDSQGALTFTAPDTTGAYRLFVDIRSQDNKVANANIPFFVGHP